MMRVSPPPECDKDVIGDTVMAPFALGDGYEHGGWEFPALRTAGEFMSG